jgi:ribosome biogenesis GTPase
MAARSTGGGSPSTLTYVVAGAGVAAIGTSLLFAVWGSNDNERLNRCAPNCSADSVEHVKNLYIASDVTMGVGVVALGVATCIDAGVNARRIERTLAAVYASGAAPAVVLTKMDLADDADELLALAREAAHACPVVAVSAPMGEGVEDVRALLPEGVTGVFVGPSGAGKSTLVNALVGTELQATGQVRPWDARGRHVTTGRRLVAVPGGGAVIDGPGIRELKLWDPEGIEEAFEDVAAIAAACRFRDCSHEDEPGCAVREAVEEGRLDPDRLESLRKLEAEARAAAARRGGAEARAERQRWRAVSKEVKRFYKHRGRGE